MQDNKKYVLASQFKKYLKEEDSVESKFEVKRYLLESYEDLSDTKFDIFSCEGLITLNIICSH